MATQKRRMKQESEKQRWDRNFADLLQELRVAQTGVQILFAFLLTLPFSAQFDKTTVFQRDIYVVALLGAAAATAMIISPVAFHRALFRQGRKPELVRYAHRMATGGLAFMLIAMVSSILLITDFLFNLTLAIILTTIAGAWFLTFWAALPFARRNWTEDNADDQEYAEGAAEPSADGRANAEAPATTDGPDERTPISR